MNSFNKLVAALATVAGPLSPKWSKAASITIVSFLTWACWVCFGPKTHPFGDLSNGIYTDHLSHLNCTRVFPRVGVKIWRESVADMFPEIPPSERAILPADVRVGASDTGGLYKVPGWPETKPLATGWSHQPRFYPPGVFLLFAPVALVYHYTELSATAANRLAILLCLLGCHIALYLLIRFYLLDDECNRRISCLGLILVYGIAIRWSLEGFYDMTAVVPLLLAGNLLFKARDVDAILAYSISIILHYRAYMFMPLAVWAVARILRRRDWKTWRAIDWIKLVTALILSIISIATFLAVWPAIKAGDFTNPIGQWSITNEPFCATVLILVLGILALIYEQSLFDGTVLIYIALFLVSVYDVRPWHILIPLSWLGFPIANVARSRALVRDIRLFIVIFVSAAVFNNPVAPVWFIKVFG